MRHIPFILLLLVLFAGAVTGTFYLMSQSSGKDNAAVVSRTTTPTDDVELVTPIIDGLAGVRKTISAEFGGSISVKDRDSVLYTLLIPPNALSQTSEIQLVPFKTDDKNNTLDRGYIIGPANLIFEKPVTLAIDLSGSKFGLDYKNGSPFVYQYELINKRFIPQLIYKPAVTEKLLPVRIISAGAYLVSLNSSRSEALSRLVLSDKTSTGLPVLASGIHLLETKKQLSIAEKNTLSAVSKSIIDSEFAPIEEKSIALYGEQLIEDGKVEQAKSESLQMITKSGLTQNQQFLIADTAENPDASAMALAYALHLLELNDSQSTYSAKLTHSLKKLITENAVYDPAPAYDFPETYTDTLPLKGYDWAILGRQLLKATYGIDPSDNVQLTELSIKLESDLKKDITVGQAYCSVYHAMKVKYDVCESFDSKVEVANTNLWQASSDIKKIPHPFGSIASEEADLKQE